MRQLERRQERLKKYLVSLQMQQERNQNRRLFAGMVVFALFFIAALAPNMRVEAPLLLFSILYFTLQVFKTQKIELMIQETQELLKFYTRQNFRQKGLPLTSDLQSEFLISEKYTQNPLSKDYDLFSNHGLFHFINETFTRQGQTLLCDLMAETAPLNISQIQNQQSRALEFSKHNGFLSRLVRKTSYLKTKRAKSSEGELTLLIEKPFVEPYFFIKAKISYVLFALSILNLVSAQIWQISPVYGPLLFFLYSLFHMQEISATFQKIQDLNLELKQYAELFSVLENKHGAPLFMKESLFVKEPISYVIKKSEALLSAQSVVSHPLVFFLLNSFLPYSFFFSSQIEKLRLYLKKRLPHYLQLLHQFEIDMSLGTIKSFHQVSWPELSKKSDFEWEELTHPLLLKSTRTKNSFELKNGHLVILTGSNMSGKSTFLRTIALNQTLANMGAPVFAKKYKSSLARVVSCIRLSDSVESGISYFYAEVLRLKELLNECEGKEDVIFLIDEIFRGTNNRERFLGAKSMVEALIKTQKTGLITTHDLELTWLTQDHPQIENYHFKETVDKNNLIFDFKIQKGPCPTTNALILMKQAGLPI